MCRSTDHGSESRVSGFFCWSREKFFIVVNPISIKFSAWRIPLMAKIFLELNSGEKNFLSLLRGSGGMLLQKILRM